MKREMIWERMSRTEGTKRYALSHCLCTRSHSLGGWIHSQTFHYHYPACLLSGTATTTYGPTTPRAAYPVQDILLGFRILNSASS